MIWHKKIQAQEKERQPSLRGSANAAKALRIGSDLLAITRVLKGRLATATQSLRRRKKSSIFSNSTNVGLVKIDARNLQRVANPSDGKWVLDYIIQNQNPIEITNLPFESLQSKKNYHPQGKNIKDNIASILEGVLKHHRFEQSQIGMFDFIFHELFLNARKYQAIALGLVEDIPQSIKANIEPALKAVIEKEQKNKIAQHKKISLVIEQHPEYIIITVWAPYIVDAKIDNIHKSILDYAPKSLMEITREVNGNSEGAGLGIPMIIQALNEKFPGSYFMVYNPSTPEAQGRSVSKIILKKPTH